jgi:beta-phosphoglucomutase-like phosphatase (HAD superfamily)
MTTVSTRYCAVLWDMDGTLIDSEPLHFRSMAHALAHLGVPTDDGLQAKTTGLSESEVLDFCRSSLGISVSAEVWAALRHDYYLARSMSLQARHGALPVFLHLAGSGVPQAVVSNSVRLIVDANMRALALDEAGIGNILSISRNDVLKAKPHPEPYLLAATRLGLHPAECLVVEDSLAGVSAGVAAGMHVLYWPEGMPLAHAHGAVTCVNSAPELEARLSALL